MIVGKSLTEWSVGGRGGVGDGRGEGGGKRGRENACWLRNANIIAPAGPLTSISVTCLSAAVNLSWVSRPGRDPQVLVTGLGRALKLSVLASLAACFGGARRKLGRV